MEIERKGGNCIIISHKKDSFVVDPKLSHLGLKDQINGATAIVVTDDAGRIDTQSDGLIIDGPGEYEVRNCSIKGVAATGYRDPADGPQKATIYRFDVDDTVVAVVGHIQPKLTEDELEALGVIDILVVPVGGYGYTLDPKEAIDLVRAIEPKAIIPTHYAEEGAKYEVPQAALEEFLKDLGAHHEVLPKLKLKGGALPDTLTVYELTRSK